MSVSTPAFLLKLSSDPALTQSTSLPFHPTVTPRSALALDEDSPFRMVEESAAADDSQRASVQLALELQRAGYEHVSVLEGGFPILVQQLLARRGTTEPIVVDMEEEAWGHYLDVLGLHHGRRRAQAAGRLEQQKAEKELIVRGARDVDRAQQVQTALGVANNSGHSVMAELLRKRTEKLFKMPPAPEEF
jgi:hypothetical protein